jgi:mannose-6-phosphate isomerase-like protein (cupin superfamily)
VTDTQGSILFRGMRNGTYRLRFEHEGFTTLERELAVRAGQPTTVSASLNAAPAKPEPPPPAPAPEPVKPARTPRVVEPRSLSLPDFLDKNLIGGQPQKITMLACAEGGTSRLVQVRDPLENQEHADEDELLYVVAGAGVIRIRNQDIKAGPGHFALVPRGVPHNIRREGRNPIILLSILTGTPCEEPAAAPTK